MNVIFKIVLIGHRMVLPIEQRPSDLLAGHQIAFRNDPNELSVAIRHRQTADATLQHD
ncbi:hypothetical protein ACFOHY_11905 [Rhizobium rosettiformans]|uniref:hypothetical protein n=1 Tax=Rhizobium rosettiformans TaxID=1368430 RepID=UPI00361805AA